jgi:HPr kinase/phosphorylase
VASFLAAAPADMELKLVAGEAGLTRRINEAAINRPGLALTGFVQYFANRRIQVVGFAEHSYLSSLDKQERRRRLREFFGQKIPCLVVSRGKGVFSEIRELAEEFRVPVMRTTAITKHFVNAATIIMENLMAPRSKEQGTMMEIMGIGVLLEGPPGIGKSDTALSLIKKGYALVSDDITAMRLDSSGSVIATPVSITRYHMEIRGLGIVHVPSLFGVASVRQEKRLDLVVSLCAPDKRYEEDRGGEPRRSHEVLGVPIPVVVIAVMPGRDIANIVEAAALDVKLRLLGHDAEKELDEKLVAAMTGSKEVSD